MKHVENHLAYLILLPIKWKQTNERLIVGKQSRMLDSLDSQILQYPFYKLSVFLLESELF